MKVLPQLLFISQSVILCLPKKKKKDFGSSEIDRGFQLGGEKLRFKSVILQQGKEQGGLAFLNIG